MKSAVVIIGLVLSGHILPAPAQSNTWRTQAACQADFTVQLPVPLYKVSWFEGKHGPSFEPDEGFDKGGVSAHVGLQRNPLARQYGVVIWEVPLAERAEYRRGNLGSTNFVIGGDDADPTAVKDVNVNGLKGKEYVFAKQISEDTYTRGRVFYARGRLYMLVFVATTAADLSSGDADRFLNSFRLRKLGTS
jgi:hypothetical protein